VLRGFAAIAVLLYHTGVYTGIYFNYPIFFFENGNLGVDFFFTLSGFIITYIHLKDIKRRGSPKTFLVKRFIRIFPFYWIVLLAVIALEPSSFPGWKLFVENVLLFRLPMSVMPLKVAWSLTFEIAFYLLFALAIAAGWKIARVMMAIWVLLIVFATTFHNGLLQVLTSNMNIEFLFGCLAGYAFVGNKLKLKLSLFFTGLLLIAVIFIGFISWQGFDRFNIYMTTLMGASSGWIILHAALLDKEQRYQAFALPVLVLAGNASYAIYLTHTVYMPYLFKAFNY
jgi:peptidoglycan/LPS O-acetylase OafA/YrhL